MVRCLVRRYITDEQRKSQDFNITEDDINEVNESKHLSVKGNECSHWLSVAQIRLEIQPGTKALNPFLCCDESLVCGHFFAFVNR